MEKAIPVLILVSGFFYHKFDNYVRYTISENTAYEVDNLNQLFEGEELEGYERQFSEFLAAKE